MEVLSMEDKETLLDGFSDMEESFKNELIVIGRNTSILLDSEEVALEFDLFTSLTLILQTIFKIYISTENLEGLLSVDPTEIAKHDVLYLATFHDLEASVELIVRLINNMATFKLLNDNSKEPSLVKAKNVLVNSQYALEYFVEQFKEVHEGLIKDN